MIMAEFRPDDALITGREALQAGEAVTLIETFLGLAPTGNTKNRSCEDKCDHSSQQDIDVNRVLSDRQLVTHR